MGGNVVSQSGTAWAANTSQYTRGTFIHPHPTCAAPPPSRPSTVPWRGPALAAAGDAGGKRVHREAVAAETVGRRVQLARGRGQPTQQDGAAAVREAGQAAGETAGEPLVPFAEGDRLESRAVQGVGPTR